MGEEAKAHSQVSITRALMCSFMGRRKQERTRRVFWSMWSLMDRPEKDYGNFGPGSADEVLLGGWARDSPNTRR